VVTTERLIRVPSNRNPRWTKEIDMVFVRVHLLKNYLSTEQKRELGDRLIAAIAEAENLHNSERHQQTSWVQYIELDRDNWYLPIPIGKTDAFVQADVIAPQEYLPTPADTRAAIEKVTTAIRGVVGDGLLPARGPWVQVHVIPKGNWGMDGSVPDFEAARAYFTADTSQQAAQVLETVLGRTVDPADVI
jgi:phenylpyruvate tautomerase PptA (4-oxalocrotonate tautomerase family)